MGSEMCIRDRSSRPRRSTPVVTAPAEAEVPETVIKVELSPTSPANTEVAAEAVPSPTEAVSTEHVPSIEPTTPTHPPPPVRRLRIGVDYHNVIQLTRWSRNSRGQSLKEDFIPAESVRAIRLLASEHDVQIYSFAGAQRSQELRNELERSGIAEIIGGQGRIHASERIKARVGERDHLGRYRPGKVDICVEDEVDWLIDDSPEIVADARRRGLGVIGVNTYHLHRDGRPHFGGVESLLEAAQRILNL